MIAIIQQLHNIEDPDCDCDSCHIANPQQDCDCMDCTAYYNDRAESEAIDRAIEEYIEAKHQREEIINGT